MTIPAAQVLYEDNHLLALFKPAGTLTIGDDTGDITMVDVAREYIRTKYHKPGNVFVGVVHRLDRPVSGVLLFARTSKAASRLSDQFRREQVQKTYVAMVDGRVKPSAGTFTDWLVKDRVSNRVTSVGEGTANAQKSVMKYQVIRPEGLRTLLQLHPITGRSHQIRVQLATRGLPIVGDVKYGSKHRLGRRILLHAQQLEITHPTQKHRLTITADLPPNWQ